MTTVVAVLVAVLVSVLIGVLVAVRAFNSQGAACAGLQAVCAAGASESTPLLTHDDEPERHLEIVHVASSDMEGAATPTTGALPFIDFTPGPPPRPLPTINRAAVLAMNQGNELPLGFLPGLTDSAPPFIDFTPTPPFRTRPAINPAVFAAMSAGDELPAGFRFESEE
jgi:hypothetical protein